MAAEALHPAASPSASSALAWAAAGMELARLERHADAALLLAHALQELDATDRVTLQEKTLQRAEWSAVHAECRFELGPCADAEASLKRALADLEAGEQGGAATSGGHAHRSPGTPGTTGADAPPRARAAAAALLLMLGRIRAKAGRLAEARADLETALARLDGLPAPSSIARTEFQLAGVLAMCGELPRALELWQRAGACFAQGDPPGPMTLRARCAMNRGLVLADLGRRAEAAAAMNEALPLVEALLLAGRGHARVDLARLLRNLGFTLGRCGEHERAIATLARAAAEADAGLRQAPLASARAALRLSRGGARNSLGYSLFALGRLDEAREALQRAVRELRPWPDAPALLRDELALARSNLAHVHAQHGELAAAQRQYGLARAHFAARAAAGEAHATVSRINAELGLARVAARQGRRAGTFAPAMAELARLTHAGQLQHEPLWLSAWLAQHEAAFGDASTAPQPAAGQAADPGRRGRRGSEDVAVLVAALAAPPRHAAGQGAHPWRALAAAAQGEAAIPLALPAARPAGIELGGAGTVGTANEAVAAAWLRFMLDWASELLTGHDPHWVREHHAEVDAAIEALRRNAERHREPAVPLAEWFLGTRGLRAQRSALADSEQPELVELREALRRLHRIEHEILGQQDDGAEAPGPAEGRGAAA
ncbi:MAG: hypothetical protein KIT17_18705, partial [Rubrivivax sp.]|nr:hypothetical protein [Rubrivivax sp.]